VSDLSVNLLNLTSSHRSRYKHAVEQAQKKENVTEKYKKKLEESVETRRTVKARTTTYSIPSQDAFLIYWPSYLIQRLEEQNATLIDKNASLEEEYRKVSAFRPLMESYKSQIAELEAKSSSKTKELETLRYQLEQAQAKLTIIVQERAQDAEALSLYQERVKELELVDVTVRARPPSGSVHHAASPSVGSDLDGDTSVNLEGELDDAITGRTSTDLKLEIRALKRELNDLRTNSGDASRVLVLENLLEDAQRMKTRYESDYLSTYREKLALQGQLNEIRSGKSMGDG
jgi:protein HOOK3